MRTIQVLLFLLLSAVLVKAQKKDLELDLMDKNFVNISGAMLGDSIFFTLNLADYKGGPVTTSKSYWLSPNGHARTIDLPNLTSRPLLNIASNEDSTYYYFIEGNKKRAKVNALVVGNETMKGGIASGLMLDTKVYGSYIENGDLYLLTVLKSGLVAKLIQLRGMKVVSEKTFGLPFDLAKVAKGTATSFYSTTSLIMPSQIVAPIKIIKEKDEIIICIDEPRPDTPEETPVILYRTRVLRLNLMSGEVTSGTFVERTPSYFNSTVFKGHLFRLVQNEGFRLDIFDLSDERKVASYVLSSQVEYPEIPVYARDGKLLDVFKENSTFKKKNVVNNVIRSFDKCFIIVDSTKSDSLILTLGVHSEISPRVPMSAALGPLGVLLPAIATAAIKDLREGPEYYQYFYSVGTLAGGFRFASINTGLLRQKIDEFEIRKAGGLNFKGYISGPNAIYGIYQFWKVIQFVRFEIR